jgi:SAM-dependent methyltransferase
VNHAGRDVGELIGAELITVDALVARMRQSAAQRRAPMELDVVARPSIVRADGKAEADTGQHEIAEALLAQADFNRSLAETLAIIGQGLKAMDARITAYAEKSQRTRDQVMEEIGRLATAVDARARTVAARLEHAEQKLSHDLDQLRETVLARVDGVETKVRDGVEQSERSVLELRTEFSELDHRLTDELAGIAAHLNDVRQGIRDDIAALDARVKNEVDQSTASRQQFTELEHRLAHQLDAMQMRMLRAERGSITSTVTQSPDTGDSAGFDGAANTSGDQRELRPERRSSPNVGSNELGGLPFDYFMFEHRFRGPVSEIKRRHTMYLPLFHGCQNVLDAGCGRGEFVELLSEQGIHVTGIDNSEDMADFCRDRGLRVVYADMFNYLRDLPDASLDGFFSAQVVEHLPPERILELVALCGQKLKTGGVVVIETQNPACPEALGNFHVDPTHVRPVPAKMLSYMLEQRGFQVQSVKFSAPIEESTSTEVLDVTDDFPRDIRMYQDYAVVARRP